MRWVLLLTVAATKATLRSSSNTIVTLPPFDPIARIAAVRVLVLILVLLILLLGGALPAPADVIHLKNGRTIWADQVRENKDHIEYDVGEDTYAIPKSSVERVDAGGVAPAHSGHEGSPGAASGGAPAAPDITPPAPSFNHEAAIADKVIHDGKVDTDALALIEEGNEGPILNLRLPHIFSPASTNPIMATFPRQRVITNRRCAFSRITLPCSSIMPPR